MIRFLGPSSPDWSCSHPFRVRLAYGYAYCPTEASAREWCEQNGTDEIEFSPRMALGGKEHPADEPKGEAVADLRFRSSGKE